MSMQRTREKNTLFIQLTAPGIPPSSCENRTNWLRATFGFKKLRAMFIERPIILAIFGDFLLIYVFDVRKSLESRLQEQHTRCDECQMT